MPEEAKFATSIALPRATLARIDDLAKKTERSRSKVIEKLVNYVFEEGRHPMLQNPDA